MNCSRSIRRAAILTFLSLLILALFRVYKSINSALPIHISTIQSGLLQNVRNPYPASLNRSELCVIYNFTHATGLTHFQLSGAKYEPISLCLHSTMEMAHHILDQLPRWDDFISYSLLVRQGEEPCLELLIKSWHCHHPLRDKVSIHLVWSRGPFQKECGNYDVWLEYMYREGVEECDRFRLDEESLRTCALKVPDLIYPINKMRNIARQGAATRLHLVADVDNFFSKQFSPKIRPLAMQYLMPGHGESVVEGRDKKAVLVFRRFEVEMDLGVELPQTVEDLYRMVVMKKANFFHSRYYPAGHHIPQLRDWYNYSLSSSIVILTKLNYTRFALKEMNAVFEPQFVMHADAPFHFEAVPGRHFDHQVLVNELCRAGYEFLLLSHVFNVHPGMKTEVTLVERLIREVIKDERPLFKQHFNAYLDGRYPLREDCPRIT